MATSAAANPEPTPGEQYAAALAAGVCSGDRSAIARALNLLDDRRESAREPAGLLLRSLVSRDQRAASHLVGMTGPPGAGKSTLTAALISAWRARGDRVAVLAVDPSSPLSGGALLGDRLRMQVAADDDGVFIRSLASRGSYGGLATEVLPMAHVLLAAFDHVVIETVGVGQREVDVAETADTTCLVLQPGAGDSVQFLKAGVMEVPDLLVVNKADLGALAERTRADLAASLPAGDRRIALATSAIRGDGVDTLVDALDARFGQLCAAGALAASRRGAEATWLLKTLMAEFGTHGLGLLGGAGAVRAAIDAEPGAMLDARDALRAQILAQMSRVRSPLSTAPGFARATVHPSR